MHQWVTALRARPRRHSFVPHEAAAVTLTVVCFFFPSFFFRTVLSLGYHCHLPKLVAKPFYYLLVI